MSVVTTFRCDALGCSVTAEKGPKSHGFVTYFIDDVGMKERALLCPAHYAALKHSLREAVHNIIDVEAVNIAWEEIHGAP